MASRAWALEAINEAAGYAARSSEMDHVIEQIEDRASWEQSSELNTLLSMLREGHERISVQSADPHDLADMLHGVFGITVAVEDDTVLVQVVL
jgi:hypothetical protein